MTRTRGRRRKWPKLAISTVLGMGIGLLVLVAVASTLVVAMLNSGRATLELLRDYGGLALDSLEQRIDGHFAPVTRFGNFLAGQLGSGAVDFDDHERLQRMLELAMIMEPEVTGVMVIDTNAVATRAARQGDGIETEAGVRITDPGELRELSAVGAVETLAWGPIYQTPEIDAPIATLFVPVHRDGQRVGTVIVGTSLAVFSDFLEQLRQDEGITAFVLYDGANVLAHPNLAGRGFADFADHEHGLPGIGEVGDAHLATLELEDGDGVIGEGIPEADFSIADSDEMVYIFRGIDRYGTQPWTLGLQTDTDEIKQLLFQFLEAGTTGLGILVVAVAAGYLIGLPIRRQIRRLATASRAVAALDFSAVPELPDSRVRELSVAADAFNAMVKGLRWFEAYVPKSVADRLMRSETAGPLPSEQRMVTLMFTDLRRFSTLMEGQSAERTLSYLNAHFSHVAASVEGTGGTVDKFIGDAVMAFWGAPDSQSDHCARAVEAARTIAAEHCAREAEKPPGERIGLRLALFTGHVLVGNIGPRTRLNYTAVGDAANTASRICELAKELLPANETVIVVADQDTCRAAGLDQELIRPVGSHRLRGLRAPVELVSIAVAGSEI